MHLRHPMLDDDDQWTTDDDPSCAEDEIQTLYVYLDDPDQPHWNKEQVIAACMGVLALALILALCFIPTGVTYQIQTITVPASFQTLHFTAERAIVPTGKENHPAIAASGILTIYNGSVFPQQLPAHFIVSTQSGTEVETDTAVTIEAANPPTLGKATVSAHAMQAGSQGNIPAFALNQTYNGSLFLKNLTAFSGGQDATITTYATNEDRAIALDAARTQLAAAKPIGLQAAPCAETSTQDQLTLSVVWSCQYVTYHAPRGVQVLAVSLAGASVRLTVRVALHPVTTHFSK